MTEIQNKLIAKAIDFVSFIVENKIKLTKAILFGSVLTKNFDVESDIDIFLETDEKEDNLNMLLNEFEKTKGETWRFKNIENPISLKIGKLEKWPSLRRSIQSNGLLLYSSYKEVPEKIENYILFILNFRKISRSKKVSLWRKLYGYSQKIKNKVYINKGLIKKLEGKKLERSVIAIPSSNAEEFKDFLHKNKINYELYEIWSDSL